jgi:RNA polymerase sigma-70 factor (ECF subfamily)
MNQDAIVLEQAWTTYKTQLFKFIRSRVDSATDAEDILNDVFVKLMQQTAANKAPDSIASWLYRVTKNAIVDYYRSSRPLDELPEDISVESSTNSAFEQLSKCMLPMILVLPDIYQQPLMLSEIEGIKNSEIAKQLDISLAAVKSRILRGRVKLYRSLIQCCTIHKNNAGMVVDFEQKTPADCIDCE